MHWELIKLRKMHNITQEQMAEILGINPSTYSNKERGKGGDFKLAELFIIARLFNKRIDEIFLARNIGKTDILNKEGEKRAVTN